MTLLVIITIHEATILSCSGALVLIIIMPRWAEPGRHTVVVVVVCVCVCNSVLPISR